MNKGPKEWRPEGVLPLCPLCGRELPEESHGPEGYLCKCGELIADRLVAEPFEGCTHGLNCNCGRERGKRS